MFRRRLAPIAFILAIALIGHEQCNKMQRTHATVVLDFADVAPRVVTVDAEVKIGDESAAIFHREAHGHGIDHGLGPCKFELALPVDDADLTVDVDLGAGPKHIARKLHLTEGATITVPLARELR
jgi:hypothetical protein